MVCIVCAMTNPYSNSGERESPYASSSQYDWAKSDAQAPNWQPPQSLAAPGPAFAPQVQPRSWVITVLLCLFLGFFGAHSFYAGYTKRGLFQLGLYLAGWLMTAVLIGILFWIVLVFWVIVDLCLVFTRSGTFRTDARGVRLLR